MKEQKNKPVFHVTKKDLTVTWFSGSGAGGQHRNRHMNCCRIKHDATGIIVTGQSHKEARANKREALENLIRHPKFMWFCEQGLQAIETGISIEERVREEVDRLMAPENIMEIPDEKDFRLLTKGKKKSIIDGVEIYE